MSHNTDSNYIHSTFEKNVLNSVALPLFQTASFEFEKIENVEEAMGNVSDEYIYTRGDNPTLIQFEEKMAVLENGLGAVSFSSGMGAISSVLISMLKEGDTLITHHTLYGSSASFCEKILPQFGIKSKAIDLSQIENLKDLLINDKTIKVLYFETPVNPNLQILDIKSLCQLANENNIKVVIDNTFASPYLQNPLDLGADIVVHSTTKFVNGHGDALGGIAVSNDSEYLANLRFNYMCNFGNVMSPFNAWLTMRGLMTLPVRLKQEQANALKLAEFLDNHEKIDKVNYPGLKNNEYYNLAQEQMKGPGAILSFELKNKSLDTAKAFVNQTNLFKIAVSVGDCSSHIEIPSFMTHRGHTKEELEKINIAPNLIRISTGLEDVEDLLNDLEDALERL